VILELCSHQELVNVLVALARQSEPDRATATVAFLVFVFIVSFLCQKFFDYLLLFNLPVLVCKLL
jgi:hypothetical protein